MVLGLTYLVTNVSLDVLGMTVDTIFICFCVDCEEHNGKDKPYFMSIRLMVRS